MTTLVAADGERALAVLAHIVPDLILLDALKPRMDGFATARAIKAETRHAHIPVIFMTGLSDTENVVRGFDAGGVDYITKPVVPEILLARIRAHLASAALAQSARQALDMSGAPLLAARADGTVLWVTPRGLERLGADWRGHAMAEIAAVIAGKAESAALPGGGGPVFLSLVGEVRTGEYLLRLKDAGAPSEQALLKGALPLTDREAEVLAWIAKGKSNRDIAEILACSPRTVKKHLEQIYAKLQVENRTAAAMRAIQVVSEA
jgi:DNA-binding NarL/FixJ family response regulator